MAYGKIKLDTITWDNSGTDTDIAVSGIPTTSQVAAKADLASPVFTGSPTVPGYAPLASPALTGTTTAVNITLSGDLVVNGTTTTVASSTMTVADKNIEIAKGAANDAAADGAGITVDSGDGDKTWNWVNATDAWTSSEHIHVGDNKKVFLGTGQDCFAVHDGSHSYISNTGGSLFIKSANQVYIQDDQGRKQITCVDGGAVELYHGGVDAVKLATSSTGVTVTGSVTDSKGDVRKIPINAQSSSYTLISSDAGKTIRTTAGVTIPSGIFYEGEAITIFNNSGSDITITQGSNQSTYNAADGSTGNRTLAGRGLCTVLCAANNVFVISGAGLS